MTTNSIRIRGARQHNLQGIDIDIPLKRMTVITGPSGSGKSSLAFDTLYAEGQRRYIESLSTYARQFLERMPKPDVDSVENVQPALAIEQRNPVRNSRSTVSTLTEIYDYLRLLWAKVSKLINESTGAEAIRHDPVVVCRELMTLPEGTRLAILEPVTFEPRPQFRPADLLATGRLRFWADGKIVDIEDPSAPSCWKDAKELAIVTDRLIIKPDVLGRISESVEAAFKQGSGRCWVQVEHETGLRRYRNILHDPVSGEVFLDPSPALFSFSSPLGACPECHGFGNILSYDEKLIVPNPQLSISQGAIEPWTKPSLRHMQDELLAYCKSAKISARTPWKELSQDQRDKIFIGSPKFEGVLPFFKATERSKYKLHVRVFLRRYQSQSVCEACNGARLQPEVLRFQIGGLSIADFCRLTVEQAISWLSGLRLLPVQMQIAAEPVRQVRQRLECMAEMGLGYLGLDRLGRTLSGGEYQRLLLSNQLGNALTGSLYVLDEPSIGLHPRDTTRLIGILHRLRERGNSVVVVEHDREVIRSADWVAELGPGAGRNGGKLVFGGTPGDLSKRGDTPTARVLNGDLRLPPAAERHQNRGWVKLGGARENNLRDLTVRIPLGNFICVTGVSGSGKTTLIVKTLYRALSRIFNEGTEPIGRFDMVSGMEALRGVALIDQSPLGRSSRSNPVTYLKAFDEIRELFAQLPDSRRAGLKPSSFSFNVEGGRCPVCSGEGIQTIDLQFLADVEVPCEACNGRRYKPEVLRIRYKTYNISDVLGLTVSEAISLFPGLPSTRGKLMLLESVGLGYLRLGQSSSTLSGGEAQRLKIAGELAAAPKGKLLYILDEPTTGLHGIDVARLLRVLQRLVDDGHTVIVIEHNLDVIARADWVIDLGPEGGTAGGEIVAEGPPEQVAREPRSITGQYLRPFFLESRSERVR